MKVQTLLDKNVIITDLKPENTLYDPDSRKATIIDVAGALKMLEDDTLENFKINTYDSFTISPYFCAPEMNF